MRVDDRLERLALFGHGVGAAVNLLGIAFNRLSSGKWLDRDVVIHALALGYHGSAVWKHRKRLANNHLCQTQT